MALLASRLRQPGFGTRARSSDDVARRAVLRDGLVPIRSCRGTSLPPIESSAECRLRQPRCSNVGGDHSKDRALPPIVPRGTASAPAALQAVGPASQANRRSGSCKKVWAPLSHELEGQATQTQDVLVDAAETGTRRRRRSNSTQHSIPPLATKLDTIPTPTRRPRSPAARDEGKPVACPSESTKNAKADLVDRFIALNRPSHLNERIACEDHGKASDSEILTSESAGVTAVTSPKTHVETPKPAETLKKDAVPPPTKNDEMPKATESLKKVQTQPCIAEMGNTCSGNGQEDEIVERRSIDGDADEAFCRRHQPEIAELLRTGSRARLQRRGDGGVGLLNQGATCYMNSLLQALFYAPEFRRALYAFRYCKESHGDGGRCIPLQLQRLFAELQLSIASAVSTKALTAACGFTAMDAMEQHDVQELCRVLFDALGRSASCLATEINQLYAGKVVHYIRSRELHDGILHEGRQEESFLDLQVPIASSATLEESLRKMLEPEVLDGDNCWLCEELGEKVAALKGIEFEKLPQIFCFQLNRFVFDYSTMRRRKLTDELFIPLKLDLSFFLRGDSPVPYNLMAICLHRGTAHGGHYHAYVQEPHSGEWRDANDSNVQLLGPEEMERLFPKRKASDIEGNGEYSAARGLSSSDAYFLIYRRESLQALAMHDGEVPEPHCSDIRADNDRLADLQRAYKLQQELLEIKVFAPSASHRALARHVAMQLGSLLENGDKGSVEEEPQSISLSMSEHRTVSHVLQKALAAFAHQAKSKSQDWKWADGLHDRSLSAVRLRICDACCRELGRPLGESDMNLQLSQVLGPQPKGMMRGHASFHLELSEDMDFDAWDQKDIPIAVCFWDVHLKGLSLSPERLRSFLLPPEESKLIEDSSLPQRASPSVASVRKSVADALHVNAEDVGLVSLTGSRAGKEIVDDNSTLVMCGICTRDVICAEVRKSGEETLQAMELYERVLNTVHLRYNHPDRPLECEEMEIAISKCATIAELKSRIAKELGLEPHVLHLRRGRKSPQLKDEMKLLREVGISGNETVFVGHGAPCGKDEYLLQIAVYLREKGNQKTFELFEHQAQCTASVRSLREALVEPLAKWRESGDTSVPTDSWPSSISWKRLRLRDGQANRQFAVLRDDRTLRSALPGIGDGRQIAVQFLDADECLGSDDIIMSIRPWRVLEGRLHAPTEFVISKTQTLEQFHSLLESRFSGLLQQKQTPEASEEPDVDRFQVVSLPTTGPPLTSQRCATLKWTESRLNAGNAEMESVPIADIRDFRDGATFIIRSRMAGITSEQVDIAEIGSDPPAEKDAKPSSSAKAKPGVRKPVAFSLATKERKERSLHIEVMCPDENIEAQTSIPTE